MTAAAAADRLAQVRQSIERACAAAGRSASEVTLIGVSKRQPAQKIAQAVSAGLRHIGENYVQELQAKRPDVEALISAEQAKELHWHMIGGLQRNKARAVVPLVASVDSLDRESLAKELDRRAAEAGRVLDVCIQVNLSEEPQKSGVMSEATTVLLAACAGLAHLRVTGLMTVPAAGSDPEASRPAFARLRALRDTLQKQAGGGDLRELSMGMSGDFEVAIEEGATQVRIGTTLFGPRPDR
jgi:pyridoxal phosphate enzyme (YggS family)